MMRLQRASVIVTVVLLTCAATAYAECAWTREGRRGNDRHRRPPLAPRGSASTASCA